MLNSKFEYFLNVKAKKLIYLFIHINQCFSHNDEGQIMAEMLVWKVCLKQRICCMGQ